MKKLNFSIGLLICLNSYSQNESLTDIDYQEEKYDTITCEHFLQAHEVVKRNGTSKYVNVVDFPILKYIHDTNECDNLRDHNISVNDLKYFIFTILSNHED